MEKNTLINNFCDKASKGEAAFFIGAGISVPYGLPDFEKLIKSLSKSILDLKIDKKTNYPEIAQYVLNEFNERCEHCKLNECDEFDTINKYNKRQIVEEVSTRFRPVKYDASKSKYLDYITRSHVNTIFTTNFDTLIEDCLDVNGIEYNAVSCNDELKYCFEAKSKKDIIKIHGDINSEDIIITKNDYEDFAENNRLFVRRLEQDLLTKSLLFIGYSYNDPNIQNIVNNVRLLIGGKSIEQRHYMVLTKPKRRHEQELQDYWIKDLARYGIQVHLINKHSELEAILREISFKSKGKTVYVTGSHKGNKSVETYAKELGERLADQEDIILNYGQSAGVGNLIFNAFGKRQIDKGKSVNGRIRIFPNPYTFCDDWDNQDFLMSELSNLRKELLQETRLMIAFPGGKGTKREIEIAEKTGTLIIPFSPDKRVDNDFYDYLTQHTLVLKNLSKIDANYCKKFKRNTASIGDVIECVNKNL